MNLCEKLKKKQAARTREVIKGCAPPNSFSGQFDLRELSDAVVDLEIALNLQHHELVARMSRLEQVLKGGTARMRAMLATIDAGFKAPLDGEELEKPDFHNYEVGTMGCKVCGESFAHYFHDNDPARVRKKEGP